MTTIRGVLFDFSGTLFRLEVEDNWLDGLMDDATAVELMQRLTAPVGGHAGLPPELHEAWERRDLDQEQHRTIHVELLMRSGLDDPAVAEKIYYRLIEPQSWQPYPDTVVAMRQLKDAGIPVGVLSNIGWDIRPVLDLHGALGLADQVLMSYVEGRIKPDPELFRIACQRIGVEPEQVLMVGDSTEADGGAEAIGSTFALVEPLPTDERPDALLRVLRAHGL